MSSNISQLWRERVLAAHIEPFINHQERIIDIGAGSCNLTHLLRIRGYDIAPIDVVNHNRSDVNLELYDGKKLPYNKDSFDVGLLVFVLHHASSYEGLLKESSRVAKRLIVIEDCPGSFIEKTAWHLIDYALNHAVHKDVAVAEHAKSVADWQSLFNEGGCKTIITKTFRSFATTLGAYPHSLFILERP